MAGRLPKIPIGTLAPADANKSDMVSGRFGLSNFGQREISYGVGGLRQRATGVF
jgi:hypothetical protein